MTTILKDFGLQWWAWFCCYAACALYPMPDAQWAALEAEEHYLNEVIRNLGLACDEMLFPLYCALARVEVRTWKWLHLSRADFYTALTTHGWYHDGAKQLYHVHIYQLSMYEAWEFMRLIKQCKV
jgi:hypothetical protein